MKRAYVDITEGQVHYRTEGSGEVIMLLHMAGSSSAEFTRVIPFLSKTHRAIAIDFLGFGESDPAPRKYQVEDHAWTVINVMDALGINRASIVGHASGSEVVVEIAVTCPDHVDNLVLSSIPYFKDENERITYISKPVYNAVEIEPDGSHLMEWWQRAARYGDPPEIVDERVLDFHKAGSRGEELHEAAFAYAAKLPEKLPLIKCPTLVLSASESHWKPVAQDVKRFIPRSKLVNIENGPVNIDSRMPKEFAEVILNFLKNPGV